MEHRQVVVIGAGTSGLCAAWTLKKQGLDVLVLEANDRAGGRLGGDRVGDFYIDEGVDFLTSSHDVAHQVVREFDLSLCDRPMKVCFFMNGRYHLLPPATSPGLRHVSYLWKVGLLSPRSIRASLKLFKIMKSQANRFSFAKDSQTPEFDPDENFIDYLKGLGAPQEVLAAIRSIVEVTLLDRLEKTGPAHGLTYSTELITKFGLQVPVKGAGSIAHALIDACGDAIRVSAPVRRVEIEDGFVTRVVYDGGVVEADAVICTAPATKTPDIIPDLPTGMREALGKVYYSSACRVVLGLDHPVLPRDWSSITYPDDENMPLILERTKYLPACAPPGKHMLDMLIGHDRAAELFPLDDDEIRRQLLSHVRSYPLPQGSNFPDDDDDVLFTRVYRWKEAICFAPPGMFTAIKKLREGHAGMVGNLFLAGDYMGRMPSMNGALASGIDAAERAISLLA